MIKLSNGHELRYIVASGAAGFDGQWWLHEKPLVWLGLIKPELFTIGIRTLTRYPRLYPVSNLSWRRPRTWLPWSSQSCIRFLPGGGAINKVGLYNPGIDLWIDTIYPRIKNTKTPLIGSINGNEEELMYTAKKFNDRPPFVALELNESCPNTGHPMDQANTVIKSVLAVKKVSSLPLILKVSVDQDYLAIARGVAGAVEAISLNTVPWKLVFPDKESPLEKIGKPGSGGGGVSGPPAQRLNWTAVTYLAKQGLVPVIGPSAMNSDDVYKLECRGAKAISFGTIHLRTPWRPTSIVLGEMRKNRQN